MSYTRKVVSASRWFFLISAFLTSVASAIGQVSPTEVINPRAKANEKKYLPKLKSLQQAIGTAKFPFSFRLARYLNAKPGQRAALDSDGIEFVYFQHQIVLKVSGLYKAAFNSAQLSENERASRTLKDTAVPILRLLAKEIPRDVDCDNIGFEIVYDSRDSNKVYDYEGQEVITIVFNRDDAFDFANATTEAQRQEILNRSQVFVNGKDFGLALGQRYPLNAQALDRQAPPPESKGPSRTSVNTSRGVFVSPATSSPADSAAHPPAGSNSYPTFADAMRLQTQFETQTDAIMKEEGARLHLEQSTAPSFEISGDQILLHFTMRNTTPFERSTTSIYKRAAQSFDLFLAPALRNLSRRLPATDELEAVDFTVLNRFVADKTSPETIDYICPMDSMRSFVANKITSQDLINQSTVLVDGVRIGLNLQLVE